MGNTARVLLAVSRDEPVAVLLRALPSLDHWPDGEPTNTRLRPGL
jgi:hypothetical protein